MVAGCPKCSARYRVDPERIGPEGAKLRCTKCSAVFLVRAPKAVEPAPAPTPVEAPVPPAPAAVSAPASAPPAPAAVSAPASAPAAPDPAPEVDRERLVLIADPDDARGKASAAAVESWGLVPYLVPDGVEAMLAIQRLLPRAVVLDAALPKMFGFQVCEVVKRNESLRDTVVVLVGAIHHQSRYRRDPADLYGADVYIEQPDLPDGLQPILRDGGLSIGGAAPPADPTPAAETSSPEPAFEAPSPAVDPPALELDAPSALELDAPSAAPAPALELDAASPPPALELDAASPPPALELDVSSGPPALELDEPSLDFAPETPSAPVVAGTPVVETTAPAADEDPETTEERERAQRLARIAVSEMLLYQPEKFEQATRDGNLAQVLDLEIQEARALLRQRIREDVREETDFIMDELNRVAAERSAQG